MWNRAERDVDSLVRLFKKYGISKSSRILEIGCGNGRILINLAKKGFKNLSGIDISPAFIEDAKRKMSIHNVSDINFYIGDVRTLDKLFKEDEFDVILSVWTSILGYYDSKTDKEILYKCWKIASEDGYLMFVNTANRDFITNLRSLGCRGPFYSDYGDFAIIEETNFDYVSSHTNTRWLFYEKLEDGSLKFIDKVEIKLRLYSIHEVIEMAESVGWSFIDAFRSLDMLDTFLPTLSPLNMVFKKMEK